MTRLKDFNCGAVPEKVLRKANECVYALNSAVKASKSKSKVVGELFTWVTAIVNSANLSKEARMIN